MTDDVLVIGYGNALRTDDGLGWHAARRLADDPRLEGVTVIGRHQLTPELALEISRAALVVFIDASRGPAAGTFTMEPLQTTAGGGAGWSHILTPASLVDLAGELYGAKPDAIVVRVGAESMEVGDRLTPVVEASLPRLLDAVAGLIAEQAGRAGAVPSEQPRHA